MVATAVLYFNYIMNCHYLMLVLANLQQKYTFSSLKLNLGCVYYSFSEQRGSLGCNVKCTRAQEVGVRHALVKTKSDLQSCMMHLLNHLGLLFNYEDTSTVWGGL